MTGALDHTNVRRRDHGICPPTEVPGQYDIVVGSLQQKPPALRTMPFLAVSVNGGRDRDEPAGVPRMGGAQCDNGPERKPG
jgi:hypothetical protein